MVQQAINIGTAANDGTGDTIRSAFDKTNDNFTELYAAIGALPEQIRDVIGAALVAGANVTISVNDAGDTITIASSGGGSVSFTSAGEVRTGTEAAKAIAPDKLWSAADLVALTDAATIAVDMATFLNATVTLSGNRTLGAPSNLKNGQSGVIKIVQDGTGSRTLAYHSDWKFAGGADPVLSTAAGSIDLLYYQVLAANLVYSNLVKAIA